MPRQTITLSQGEIADILVAALGYNGIEGAKDVAFQISGSELLAHITADEIPLRVRDKPDEDEEQLGWDSLSIATLQRMRERHGRR